MTSYFRLPVAPAAPPNAVLVNSAGQVYDTVAKSFEATPSASITTPATPVNAAILGPYYTVTIPITAPPGSALVILDSLTDAFLGQGIVCSAQGAGQIVNIIMQG